MTINKAFFTRRFGIVFFSTLIINVCFAQKNDSIVTNIKGKLVDLGGYKLHINEQGNGKPTVVLISGSLAFSFDWYFVQKEVIKFSKVVSYDRPGLAWSDPGPSPRTMQQDVYELHQLLLKSNLKPPFVLVAHSLGGLIARIYNKEYPNEVEGMVLVDPTSENGTLFINRKLQKVRLLSSGKKIPPIKKQIDSLTKLPSQKDIDDLANFMGKPKSEFPFTLLPDTIQKIRLWARSTPGFQVADAYDFWAEELQQIYTDSLKYRIGNKPLVVITGAKGGIPKEMDSLFTQNEIEKISNEKRLQKMKIAELSTNNKFITAINSGHEIHIEDPELVINAIQAIIQSIRLKKSLDTIYITNSFREE